MTPASARAPSATWTGSLSPPPPAAAVIAFLFGPLAEHPKGVSRPLRHDLLGMHGARRGDYRVIYEIDDQESTVLVHRIDHRAHVCRPR